jgi:hypothetical protein
MTREPPRLRLTLGCTDRLGVEGRDVETQINLHGERYALSCRSNEKESTRRFAGVGQEDRAESNSQDVMNLNVCLAPYIITESSIGPSPPRDSYRQIVLR